MQVLAGWDGDIYTYGSSTYGEIPMTITLNGQAEAIADACTIATLLAEKGYGDRKIAVALNQEFVPKGQYASTTLKPDDELEIVAPMPGG